MKKKEILPKKLLGDFNKALKLQNKGNFKSAADAYENLVKQCPDVFEVSLNLATCYFALTNYSGAAALFHKLHINYPENTKVIQNAAVSYIQLNKLDMAWEFLKRQIKLEPDNINAWLNITYVCHTIGKTEEALYYATNALSLNPKDHRLYNNLGTVLQSYQRFEEAKICYETTLELCPNEIKATINLGVMHDLLKEYEKALPYFEKALNFYTPGSQEDLEAKYRMSYPLLATGNLERGWAYYEYGFIMPNNTGRNPVRNFKKPRWEGQRLDNQKLMIWREQGIGDEVWFFSLLNEVKPYCQKIVIECSDRLITLLQRSFPEFEVRAESELVDYDFQIPAGSLCKIFRNSSANLSYCEPYLKPNNELIEIFRNSLSSKYKKNKEKLVGISWRSGTISVERNMHYIPISEWEIILSIPNIKFVNLQYGDCAAEIEKVKDYMGVEIINFTDVDLKNDLESLAAIIANLDFVISIGNFTSPFSQALGAPVKLVGWGGWPTLGAGRWPWYKNVEVYCPENTKLPLTTMLPRLRQDILSIDKK